MGGVDNYLLKTKPELLGYEGMRLRVMVRERKRQLEAEGVKAGTVSHTTPTPPPLEDVPLI
jgi:large subunit ribosomal protein L28